VGGSCGVAVGVSGVEMSESGECVAVVVSGAVSDMVVGVALPAIVSGPTEHPAIRRAAVAPIARLAMTTLLRITAGSLFLRGHVWRTRSLHDAPGHRSG